MEVPGEKGRTGVTEEDARGGMRWRQIPGTSQEKTNKTD